MRGRRTAVLATALAVGSALSLSACTPEESPPAAEAVRVELEASGSSARSLRVGVLVPPVQGAGSEFRPLVEGARVAAYRFEMTGVEIDLAVALDDGTADGARRAMQTLVDQDVVGVVAAAVGPHVAGALEVADAAGTSVLLPYGGSAGAGVWSLAPSTTAVLARVRSALAEAGAERPYLATTADRALALPAARNASTEDPDAAAAEIVDLLEERAIDSVVVAGRAADQAALVSALHGRLGSRQLPVVLTPEAVTPAFDAGLGAAGSTGGRLLTVGVAAGDHLVATGSEEGAHAAAFFAALRLAAGDPSCQNLYGDDACALSVPSADVASHDATVALVRAVEAAGSTAPRDVRATLGELVLRHVDGLAGPDLDFGTAQALADDEVVVLHASASDPGLRPVTPESDPARLSWFAGGSE